MTYRDSQKIKCPKCNKALKPLVLRKHTRLPNHYTTQNRHDNSCWLHRTCQNCRVQWTIYQRVTYEGNGYRDWSFREYIDDGE